MAGRPCLIVDADVATRVFGPGNDPDFGPVLDQLLAKKSRVSLAYGGLNRVQLERVAEARRVIAKLDSAGRALKSKDELVNGEAQVVTLKAHVSDDPHVIALARISGARLLCTLDQDLMQDFKNLALVPAPRGSVYSKKSHVHLFRRHCS